MISILNDTPENVAAFYTLGETSHTEFEMLVIPHVQKKVLNHNQLNYMLYFHDSCGNCNLELFLKDSLPVIQNICNLNRFAIVSSYQDCDIYKDFFRTIPAFDLRMFKHDELYKALYWCHKGSNIAA